VLISSLVIKLNDIASVMWQYPHVTYTPLIKWTLFAFFELLCWYFLQFIRRFTPVINYGSCFRVGCFPVVVFQDLTDIGVKINLKEGVYV